MKKLLLFSYIAIFTFGYGQERFRLSKEQIQEIGKIDPDIAKNALMVEKMLDSKSNPTIGIINQAINTSRAKEKDLEKARKIICTKCYEVEWKEVQNMAVTDKKKKDSIFTVDIPDGETYALRLKDLKKNEIKGIADEIFSLSKKKYVFYDVLINDKNTFASLIYFPENFTKEQMKQDMERSGNFCKFCVKVEYRIYQKGGNIALEKEGEERFVMDNATAPLLDLFPWWQKHFFPNAQPEDILNYKNHIFENRQRNIYLKLIGSDELWQVKNFN